MKEIFYCFPGGGVLKETAQHIDGKINKDFTL
jgi:hypothetical protein